MAKLQPGPIITKYNSDSETARRKKLFNEVNVFKTKPTSYHRSKVNKIEVMIRNSVDILQKTMAISI